ncbi:hypothetical protein CVS37_09045 [Burkholderia lata]|nr:hypothetical protein CVS37_09045 [Burkholderia lata]
MQPGCLQNTVSEGRGNPAKPRRAVLSGTFHRELRYRFCDMLRARKFRSFQARLDSQSAKRSGRVAEG